MHRYRSAMSVGLMVALLGLALSATAVEARGGPGGNSAAAKLCQQEWQTLLTVDGDSFKNIGKCVSYAAKGGEFATPAPEPEPDPFASARAFCTDVLGGDQLLFEVRNGVTVWLCSNVGELPSEAEADYDLFCPPISTITTEVRFGETYLVCTPAS